MLIGILGASLVSADKDVIQDSRTGFLILSHSSTNL